MKILLRLFSEILRRAAVLKHTSSGQAMTEYVVITGLLAATLAVLTLFLTTFNQYGTRILDMVASDYP